MKYIMQRIFLLSFIFDLFGIYGLEAKEIDKGLVIIDNKPWKTSWIQEDKNCWILKAYFDQGTLSTYFMSPPPIKGLGLSSDNKPLKQEFEFYFGQKFVSTDSQFEQWPDGAKGWGFTYQRTFKRDKSLLEFGTTAIIQEVAGKEDEIRYTLLKKSNNNYNECNKNTSTPEDSSMQPQWGTFLTPATYFEQQNNKLFDPQRQQSQNQESSLKLDELPIQEKLAHKNLSKRLDILDVHLEYTHCQNTAIVNLMQLIEDNKDSNGSIKAELLNNLIKKANFPTPETMKTALEKIIAETNGDPLVSYGVKLISKGDKDAIWDWFQLIAQETKQAINEYEKLGMNFPQYKFCLEEYERHNRMLKFSTQMLILMNPEIFGIGDSK